MPKECQHIKEMLLSYISFECHQVQSSFSFLQLHCQTFAGVRSLKISICRCIFFFLIYDRKIIIFIYFEPTFYSLVQIICKRVNKGCCTTGLCRKSPPHIFSAHSDRSAGHLCLVSSRKEPDHIKCAQASCAHVFDPLAKNAP